jgi:hypothetical protein
MSSVAFCVVTVHLPDAGKVGEAGFLGIYHCRANRVETQRKDGRSEYVANGDSVISNRWSIHGNSSTVTREI